VAVPTDIGIIDTMIGFPSADMRELYSFITRQTKDRESRERFSFPAEYMFKETPEKRLTGSADPVSVTLAEMDRWGIEMGLIGLAPPGPDGEEPAATRALRQHPDRFCASVECNPNKGMAGVRSIVRAHEEYGIKAVSYFPAGSYPQVAINDKLMYPVYAKCVELGLPIFVCAGVPGPRLKMAPQRVELIDEVMFDFPELVLVTRHGCEPWTDLAVKLLLQCVRPQVLPPADSRLRQHQGRRQGHLRRLLPHGPVAGADHDRDGRRGVQGRGMAPVPASQRRPGARPRTGAFSGHVAAGPGRLLPRFEQPVAALHVLPAQVGITGGRGLVVDRHVR
jgi:predicted TIM-barrel fold metal-dependent hydrolase